MRYTIAAVLQAVLATPTRALRIDADRALAHAKRRLERGDKIVYAARRIPKESKRVRALVRSKRHFRRARKLAHRAAPYASETVFNKPLAVEREATRALVDVLNTEAEFYFGRTSTGQAKKRNQEALTLLPKNNRALVLARDIRNGANSGFVLGGRVGRVR